MPLTHLLQERFSKLPKCSKVGRLMADRMSRNSSQIHFSSAAESAQGNGGPCRPHPSRGLRRGSRNRDPGAPRRRGISACLHWQFRLPDDMNFPFADGQGLQGVVVPFGPCGQALGTSSRTEGVAELGHGEDAFVSVSCPFLPGQIGEEAEIVFTDRVLPAPVMEPAFWTMPVDNRVRR